MTEMITPHHENICPLCTHKKSFTHLVGPEQRNYLHCHHCQLIFMASEFLPDSATEKARYKAHQNGPQLVGYVNFLLQAINPTLAYLTRDMRGLDYGCGPAPTLSTLLRPHGFHCENFDPYFFPLLPEDKFDFIFATEVVEHFFNPGQELQRIKGLLKPGGIFTIMTEQWKSVEKFSAWHYARDITHVCFYHAKTMEFICAQYGFEKLSACTDRVTILKKMAPAHD